MSKVPNLKDLSKEERGKYIKLLLKEQIIEQRLNLHFWRELTNQPAQIDTGYIAQHLVSLVTGIKGGGYRGKGDDLEDGSEVKSANFLDSLDKKGSVAPRWNFMCNDISQMEGLLNYPAIYLVSIDLNFNNNVRFRVWRLYPMKHDIFKKRYIEWMEKLGYPKLNYPDRPGVNFQLFPPKNKTNDNFARHGNGRKDGFEKLQIQLVDYKGTSLLFQAEIEQNEIIIKCFNV